MLFTNFARSIPGAFTLQKILIQLSLLLLTGSRWDRVQSTSNQRWHSETFSNPARTTLNPSKNTGLTSSGHWCANCENLLNTEVQQKSLVKTLNSLFKMCDSKRRFSQQCYRITILGSPNNQWTVLERTIFLLRVKNILLIWRTFFHYKGPFVQWKDSTGKGSSHNQNCRFH